MDNREFPGARPAASRRRLRLGCGRACFRRCLALALAVLLCRPGWSADASPELPRLFESPPPAAAGDPGAPDQRPAEFGEPRAARADTGALRAARARILAGETAGMRLNLGGGAEFDALFERSAPTANGYTLSGPLADVPHGRAVLVVNDGIVMGSVYARGRAYGIDTASHGGAQTVRSGEGRPLRCGLVEPRDNRGPGAALFGAGAAAAPSGAGFAPGAGQPPGGASDPFGGKPLLGDMSGGAASRAAAPKAAAGDGAVVDVLVLYPSFVRNLEGGYGRMLAMVDLGVAVANEAYAASGVDLRVALAAAVEVDYDWFPDVADLNAWYLDGKWVGPWVAALEHLAREGDGHLDEAHALRDRHAADLVLLHLGGGSTDDFIANGNFSETSGIAYGVPEVTAGNLERLGFSVARTGQTWQDTFLAHELGHGMGLMHERSDAPGNEPFPYSHGFRYEDPLWPGPDAYRGRWSGTIMAANGVARGPWLFSSPGLGHPDDPGLRLGVGGDEPTDDPDGPADAARHLNELGRVVAGTRSRADAEYCGYALSHDAGRVPAAGGDVRVRVETGDGCPWTAMGGVGVEAVTPASGRGSAEISYRVAANDYWDRPVDLVAANRVRTVRQAGPRRITPYRERSYSMRSTLCIGHPRFQRGGITCRQLTISDAEYGDYEGFTLLGAPRYMHEPARLGDFDGLTGLRAVEYRNFETLPAGLFEGLGSLRSISLRTRDDEDYVLSEIEPGAFRGLPHVAQIDIYVQGIQVLRAGTFEGMPRLRKLDVFRYGDVDGGGQFRIEPGVFRGLPGLRFLRFTSADPGLTRLAPGTFDGAENLRLLLLGHTGLEVAESGAFRGLSQVEFLTMSGNRLEALPPGLFDSLSKVRNLWLGWNRISVVPPGLFRNLGDLRDLTLHYNRLTTLEPDAFAGLVGLDRLLLYNNRLRNLPPGLFRDLGSLRELLMWRNDVGALRAGLFEGLGRLETLRLKEARVTALEPGVLDPMPNLEILDLEKNWLHEIPSGTFHGEHLVGRNLQGLRLKGNPGAPFRFAPTPVALPPGDAAAGTPLEIAVEVDLGAPVWVRAELSAEGGHVSERYAFVDGGGQRSRPIKVSPEGDGPVTVRVENVECPCDPMGELPPIEPHPDGGISIGVDTGSGYTGFRVVPGEPLVLYGFPDLDLEPGGGVETFELGPVFSYFLGPSAEYAVESSDPAVAAARVADGVLTVNPRASGAATVTVTATGPGGETRSRSFEVRSRAPSAPLFPPAADPEREGFVRVLNRSGRAGLVRVVAVDDAGNRREAGRLRLRPRGAVHFNSGHLERGDESRGLEGVGAGRGDWRLEFATGLDIAALAYVRTADGFLTAMHDTAAPDAAAGGENAVRLPTFNPADNDRQASALRVVNPGLRDAEVSVSGVDDAGASPGGPVRFSVPAGASRSYTSAQLESGVAEGLAGALGDGAGKWRLAVSSSSPVEAMSLLESAGTGHLTNLSSPPVPRGADGVRHVPLFPPAREGPGREGFARVVNRSARAGAVRIVAYDDAGERRGPLELALGAGEARHFNSADLELGNAAKGLSGSAGAGEGNWRLELTSGLDIDVLAYVRTEDGFLTAVHDSAPFVDGRADLAILNPGSNANQVGVLRLVNPNDRDLRLMVVGIDDAGRAPEKQGALRVRVPARGALNLTAADLEAGVPSGAHSAESYIDWLVNALGDGSGKWRLAVSAELPVLAMSLVENARTGHLTNLSTSPGGVAR